VVVLWGIHFNKELRTLAPKWQQQITKATAEALAKDNDCMLYMVLNSINYEFTTHLQI